MLESKAQIQKEAQEKRKDHLKKMSEIQKSKQDLLQKLMEEQKKLIMKIETKKSTMKAEEKATMMNLLKSVTASVDKAKEEVKKAMQLSSVKKAPADVQKETT